eukprot:CAMPEP_0195620024 /NCGR_PEP_ID=MMETSP0815-20121206/14926_1 /TAXON_ID=97485 /ORGANISM="Prymnesium parvum, Strain Texoma1" /LENGTH=285 /DNA_ID=CAMNT_0040760661 /DNA_START=404 /DNA_END=1262 /DNA_ORIENTATION=+
MASRMVMAAPQVPCWDKYAAVNSGHISHSVPRVETSSRMKSKATGRTRLGVSTNSPSAERPHAPTLTRERSDESRSASKKQKTSNTKAENFEAIAAAPDGAAEANSEPNVAEASSPNSKRKSVLFGYVQVLHHESCLDGSKLPSDGIAPVGVGAYPRSLPPPAPFPLHSPPKVDRFTLMQLGRLQSKVVQCLDSFEKSRGSLRKGVEIIPPEVRRQALGICRRESVELIELENANLRRAQLSSMKDHIMAIQAQQKRRVDMRNLMSLPSSTFEEPGEIVCDGEGK